ARLASISPQRATSPTTTPACISVWEHIGPSSDSRSAGRTERRKFSPIWRRISTSRSYRGRASVSSIAGAIGCLFDPVDQVFECFGQRGVGFILLDFGK